METITAKIPREVLSCCPHLEYEEENQQYQNEHERVLLWLLGTLQAATDEMPITSNSRS